MVLSFTFKDDGGVLFGGVYVGNVAVPKPEAVAFIEARFNDEGVMRRARMSTRTRRSCFWID